MANCLVGHLARKAGLLFPSCGGGSSFLMDAVVISLKLAVGNTFLQPLELTGFSVGEGGS